MHEWINVTDRLGETTPNPNTQTLRAVLTDLFSSTQDDEHPNCWIECGSEDGPLHSLSVFQSGYAVYTKYSDVDMSETLEEKEIPATTVEVALLLWENLIQGQFEITK